MKVPKLDREYNELASNACLLGAASDRLELSVYETFDLGAVVRQPVRINIGSKVKLTLDAQIATEVANNYLKRLIAS